MNQTNKSTIRRNPFKVFAFFLALTVATAGILIGNPIKAKAEFASVESYNALSAVKAQESKDLWSVFNDENWSYEEKALVQTDNVYLPTGDWDNIGIKMGNWCSSDASIRSKLSKMYYIWDNKGPCGRGLATYNNNVIIYAGHKCPVAPTLTFTAPKTGSVRIYDSNRIGKVGGAFDVTSYTLDGNKTVGFAIYCNNEKVWPTNKDYEVLSSSNKYITFPDIANLKVTVGDKIRFEFIPLTQDWGYMALAPQIDYLSVNSFVGSYSAADAVDQQQKLSSDGIFRDPEWSYEEKTVIEQSTQIADDTRNIFLPTGDWSDIVLWKGGWPSSSEEIRKIVPSMFYKWDSKVGNEGRGLGYYNGKVVTFVGNKCPVAPTLTFTAPVSGNVRLYDPDNVSIGGGGQGSPCYTLNNQTDLAGVVIYKNDEKIWPVDSDYYILSNDNTRVSFPDLNNISLVKGEKLRIMFIPLSINWGYMTLSPHVDYQSVSENGWGNSPIGIDISGAPDVRTYFEAEDYQLSDIVATMRYADGTTKVLTQNNEDVSSNYTVDSPREIGTNKISINYDDGTYKYSNSFKVTILKNLYGDLNADSVVDSNDLVQMQRYLLGQNVNIHICVANAAGNDDVSIKDLVRIKKYLADDSIILGPVK